MAITKGRRVAQMGEIEQPGDYYGPVRETCSGPKGDDEVKERAAVYFLLPNARDPNAAGPQRSVRKVVSPPHVFRECPDGSLEIRNSIGADPYWHGWLDEGHSWRKE